MQRLTTYILISLMLLGMLYSCNTSGCLENRSAIPLAGFYSSTDSASIVLDSLCVTGIGKVDGAVMKEEGTRVNQVYLPMRSTENVTSWQFAYKWKNIANGMLADTITFDYTSDPFFASNECGVIYRYHITKMTYTRHIIESIEITDSLITNLDIERIKIYFRTQDPNDDDAEGEDQGEGDDYENEPDNEATEEAEQ